MKKVFLYLLLTVQTLTLFGQEQSKRLTFILSIDDQLPVTDITDGTFLIMDSVGTIKEKIPFNYHVGGLGLSLSDYKKLFASNSDSRILIRFKHVQFRPTYVEYSYEKEIPKGWLNEEYMVLKVYNKSVKSNRAKYFYKPGQRYIIQVKIPGSSTIPITRKK